jgi:drug/metabolite transporter (DMT)-like permease
MRGDSFPERRQWPALLLRGILLLGFGNGDVVWAEQTIPSGLAAVLVAVVPFWMVGIEALLGDGKKPTLRQIVGLLVGFFGIVVLVSPSTRVADSGAFWKGFIATQLACAGWSVGSTFARRHGEQQNDARTAADVAFEMFFGGLALLLCGIVLGEKLPPVVTARSAAAVVYLIVFGRSSRIPVIAMRSSICRSPLCRSMSTRIRSSPYSSESWYSANRSTGGWVWAPR